MKKRVILSVVLASVALFAEGNVTKEIKEQNPNKAVMMQGIKHIKILGKALKTEVGKNLKADKTGVKAAEFCTKNAKDVAKKAMADFPENIKVRRVAIKYRNPNNKPDELDLKVLNQLKEAVESNSSKVMPVVIKADDNTTRVYAPLKVEKACLKCHGDVKSMNADVAKIIKDKYPEDKAIDFKEGDFRGAAVAEIKAK
jgi:excinuclease UvrABC ATPase subunit